MKLGSRKGCGPTIFARPFLIEGEYVTRAQIAKRMGVTPQYAGTKLRKLRAQPGAITWAKLGASA